VIYPLQELLMKMGAPEVREKRRIEWHYFDRKRNALAGSASIRLEAGGERLVAELKHIRENYEDDSGKTHALYEESFFLHAERTGAGQYRVIKIAFDESEYLQPQKSVIELGLSVFHSRALDISVRMVEQAFNREDIIEPVVDVASQLKRVFVANQAAKAPYIPSGGVVVPFRPRREISARI
jgi:hypothetical protein